MPNTKRRGLYPPIEPFDSGLLRVSDIHEIYYEQCGNPDGKAAIFLHGGPGGGGDTKPRRFFDPDAYRVVLFDQRGCGRSTPSASLVDNTTWHLVHDIECLRVHLGIGKWQVFGGSWGSTLALAYAQSHPQRVTELILRGIFMLRRAELEWFYQYGASEIYPDAWEAYLAPIPPAERGDLLGAYHRRLTAENEGVRLEAARAWSVWEASTSHLHQDTAQIERFGQDEFALAFARIESHYFVHGGFMTKPGQLLDEVDKIRHIPGVIVQGRHDVVCPVRTAWDLHRAWPEAEFTLVPDAGHSAFEPGIVDALIRATDSFRR